MPVFRVAFVLHNTLKKPVFTFTRFTLKTPKTLENKGKIQYFQGLSNLPAAGLEPARCCHQWILSPPRLPFRQAGCLSTLFILPKLETDCNCFFVCFEIKKRSIRRGLRVSLK